MAKKKEYWDYETAKDFVAPLGLKSVSDWRKYKISTEFNINLPKNPYGFFKDKGWIDWDDFLGSGVKQNLKINYVSYFEYKKYLMENNIFNINDLKNNKLPINFPKDPYTYYKKRGDWVNFKDFFPKNNNSKYLSYNHGKLFVNKLNLNSTKDWYLYKDSKKFNNKIPKAPEKYYKNNGWVDWYDWLGINKKIFLSFEDAKKYIRRLNLKNIKEWKKYKNSNEFNDEIPKDPRTCYDNLWNGWGDFLGTGYIGTQKRKYWNYETAKDYVRKFDFKTREDYKEYTKSKIFNTNLYKDPYKYKKIINKFSLLDFLGEKFETLEEALAYCMKNNITNAEEYYKHWEENPDCKLPYNLKKYYNLEDKCI